MQRAEQKKREEEEESRKVQEANVHRNKKLNLSKFN